MNMRKLIYAATLLVFVACGSKVDQPINLNVMTFNMRYDNPQDSLNSWQYRRDEVVEELTAHDIDICGAQELLIHQLNDLKESLTGYACVGVGRLDGVEAGEHSALFFKKDRFEVVETGNFWLSETPEVAGSKGWDGACERIATWAILKEIGSGRELFCINTHLDHVGQVAREQGVSLLLDRTRTLSRGLPVMITGDFNADPASSVITHVTRNGEFSHAKERAAEVRGTAWSFSDFGRLPETERQLIDYIFVNDAFTVSEYEVLPNRLNNQYVSDHAPVMAKITFK